MNAKRFLTHVVHASHKEENNDVLKIAQEMKQTLSAQNFAKKIREQRVAEHKREQALHELELLTMQLAELQGVADSRVENIRNKIGEMRKNLEKKRQENL